MQIIKTVAAMSALIKREQAKGLQVGLVPTMGYFHQGHLSLMERAVKDCDLVVTSLYVNPTQFGPQEDLTSYPRDLERDVQLARGVGVQVIFAPTDGEMYPRGYDTRVDVGASITDKLCGVKRPGHFTGVATVVTKLFNIIQPQRAYFGQKDAQQLAVIERLVRDLNMDIKLEAMPIVREEDGLAMSSRNAYLSPTERQAAPVLYRSLQGAKLAVEQGERNAQSLKRLVEQSIAKEPLAQLDYVELYYYPTLQGARTIDGKVLLAVAAKFGTARLIDNIILEG